MAIEQNGGHKFKKTIKNFFTFAPDLEEIKAVIIMKIVFATGNSGKLREASEILGGGFELVTPVQMGITDDVPETGLTLKANSIIKAEHIWKSCGCSCFADDNDWSS